MLTIEEENIMTQKPILDIHEKPAASQWLFLSIQHLFAMFGATVLVPMLTGLDPAVALISSGVGTLTFIAITRGKTPSYLGSSFAFIAPIISAQAFGGPGAAMMGTFLVGVLYAVVALIIRKTGVNWLMRLLPPVVIGPIIVVIGLGLAGTAVNMAMNDADGYYNVQYLIVALVTLAITILASVFAKGFLSVVPILIGVTGGYLFAMTQGLVDFTGVAEASWFAIPNFTIPFVHYTPEFTLGIFMLMVPVAIVPLAEHIGDQIVIGKIVDKDLIKDPGLDRSLLGDGLATIVAAILGGPPTTTYGENIGVLAITKVYSIYVFIGAATFAIIFGFIGKISALISSIPTPVMGGVSILLFGIIASSGLRMMVEEKINFEKKRNLIITSVILIIGIGGAQFNIGDITFEGMALAATIGIILNLVLPDKEIDIEEKVEESISKLENSMMEKADTAV